MEEANTLAHYDKTLITAVKSFIVQAPGNTNLSVRLSPIDLLIKVACFLTEKNNIFITKAADLI